MRGAFIGLKARVKIAQQEGSRDGWETAGDNFSDTTVMTGG